MPESDARSVGVMLTHDLLRRGSDNPPGSVVHTVETAGVSAPYAVSSTHFLLTCSSQACCCCNITRSEIDRRIQPKKN